MGSKQYRLTKVRNRQAVWLPAVQPVVMTTGTLACFFYEEKNENKRIETKLFQEIHNALFYLQK